MSDAYIIETSNLTAGIVAAQERGYRFYASHPAMLSLEGKIFDSLKSAQRAAEALDRPLGSHSVANDDGINGHKAAKWGYPRANMEKLEISIG